MKCLIGMPCLYGPGHTKEAIESIIHKKDTTVLLIDNGAERSVKELISGYAKRENVIVISNSENIYVNPAWNQIINHFLGSEFDCLVIMNSDLTLHDKWKEVIDKHFESNNSIPVPIISNNKEALSQKLQVGETIEVFEGTPGVLIVLNKEQAKLIYPIPETIKVWFGDNWIYEGLRRAGHKTVVLTNLISYHSASQNVSRVEGISRIIEQDKIEWEKLK
jgi:GT2 family glycosyltransferase